MPVKNLKTFGPLIMTDKLKNSKQILRIKN